MKFRFITLIISVFMTLVISLSACKVGGNDAESDRDVNAVEFNVPLDYSGEITVMINAYDYEEKMMDAFVKTFNTRYPNIKVNVSKITPAQYQATLQKASNIPNMMPDIYWVSPQYIGAYRDMDIILKLDDVIKQDGVFSTDDVVAESIACCMQDGSLWMLPRDFNQIVLYYNKDMFDAAGVAYPSATEAMSATEFNTLMGTLYENLKKSTKTNQYGEQYKDCLESTWDVCMTWDSVLWPMIKSFGGEIIRSDGTYMNGDKPLFNSSETMDAFAWAIDLTQNGYVEGSQATHQDGLDFKLERSPMYSHMRCNFNDLVTAAGQYKGIKRLGIAPFPNIGNQDNYYMGSGATGYAIYKNTKNLIPAWLFLKSIVSEQSQEELSKTGYATPANKAVLEDPNSEWRKYTNSKIGEGYNEPFIYRKAEAYSHVNQFLSYINYKYQDSVWFDMSTVYCQITDLCKNRSEAQQYLDLYSSRIAKYIEQGNK